MPEERISPAIIIPVGLVLGLIAAVGVYALARAAPPAPPTPPLVANLYGVVTNEAGSPIEGVKVIIDGLVTYTESLGRYAFEGLTPGSYNITFEKEGYETIIR